MRTIGQRVAAVLFVALCFLGAQVASATPLSSISGAVISSVNGKPIPALVYFKGKNVFANKTTGAFRLSGSPLASLFVGQKLPLRVLATGYAPIYKVLTVTNAHLTSGKIAGLKISMKPVAAGKPLKVTKTFKAGTEKGSFVVWGRVKDGTTPVCAVVWANGKAMSTCQTRAKGKFTLKGKLRASGKVTLKVFPLSSTYRPYSYTTPDTVTVNGRVWAQVSLFTNLSWNDINAVCPAPEGRCRSRGMLNGHDMTGWIWASTEDVVDLFNSYGVDPWLGYHPDINVIQATGYISESGAELWEAAGWKETHSRLVADGFATVIKTEGATRVGPWYGSELLFAGTDFTWMNAGGPWERFFLSGTATQGIFRTYDEKDSGTGGWFFKAD